MAKPYRLTPAQWESIERYADTNNPYSCFLELRARIEVLESAQQKIRFGPQSPLVERVADAIAAQATSAGIVNDRPARAAILVVAAALIDWWNSHEDAPVAWEAAKWLEQEANQ